MTGARFAELIIINYLPLRWQTILLIKKIHTQETLFASPPVTIRSFYF